jgi:hypothetical protein
MIRLVTRYTVARRGDYEEACVEAEKRLSGKAFQEGDWERVEIAWRPQVRDSYKGEYLIDFVRDGVEGAPGKAVYDAA